MKSRMLWLSAAILYYGAMLAIQTWGPGMAQVAAHPTAAAPSKVLYAVVYLGLGMVLLGAVAHVFAQSTAALWRPLMLCMGAGLALMHIWIAAVTSGTSMSAELWMSALLGLALTVVITRVVPERIWLRWYGVNGGKD
ncbi:MAG: hypothetical protein V3T12_06210 [Acidiferrobacterales bacterium]|jgi:hypothetical protein